MINLHLVRGTVRNDSRVLKEASTLRESGWFSSVQIVGLNEPGLPPEETLAGLPVQRIDLSTRGLSKGLLAQAVKYAEWHARIVRRWRTAPLGAIHCHDVDPLPIAMHLRRLTGAKVIYDAHELETEQGWSTARSRVYRAFERRLAPRADGMITVSQGIANWYAEHYCMPAPQLVRNVPLRPREVLQPVDLKARLGVPADRLLFIYLGGLMPGRGLEQILPAFARDDVTHHLLCMGYGPLESAVRAASQVCSRIHFLPAVPPAEVLRHAAGADVGISMIQDTCLSYRYCLPNKLFEAVMAGLPMLVSDLPEQRRFVEQHGAGWSCRGDSESIAETLRSISPYLCHAVRQGLADRTAGLGWHAEAAVLLAVYARALGRDAPRSAAAQEQR